MELEKTKKHFAEVAEAYERWKADGKEPHLFVPPAEPEPEPKPSTKTKKELKNGA